MLNNFEILTITTLVLGATNILYTYFSTKIRGPEFVMHPTGILYPTSEFPEGGLECELSAVIQSIGDRMSYLRFQSHRIEANINNRLVIFKAKKWYSELFQSEEQQSFFSYYKVPSEAKDWKKDALVVEGYYTIHKGNKNHFTWKFDIEALNEETLKNASREILEASRKIVEAHGD
ncbi:MAG: hypothetical protein ACFFBD_30425 [Candidatus Hodarchaeota archaeon]